MSKHLVWPVARARQQIPRLDSPVFPSGRDRRDLSFEGASPPLYLSGEGETGGEKRGCQWSGKLNSGFPLTELDGETRLPIVTKVMGWESITTLLIVATLRPFASYQMPRDFVVCADSVLAILTLLSTKHEIETHYDNSAWRVTVKLRAWRS